MSTKLKTIYIISDSITSLEKNKMKTSSQKYELGLAEHLSKYTIVKTLTLSMELGEEQVKNNVCLCGVNKALKNKQFNQFDYVDYLQKCDKEDAIVVFWGYSIYKVSAMLTVKWYLKYKCIAFEYDSHKIAIKSVKGLKYILLDLSFKIGKFLLRYFDGFILFQSQAVKKY